MKKINKMIEPDVTSGQFVFSTQMFIEFFANPSVSQADLADLFEQWSFCIALATLEIPESQEKDKMLRGHLLIMHEDADRLSAYEATPKPKVEDMLRVVDPVFLNYLTTAIPGVIARLGAKFNYNTNEWTLRGFGLSFADSDVVIDSALRMQKFDIYMNKVESALIKTAAGFISTLYQISDFDVFDTSVKLERVDAKEKFKRKIDAVSADRNEAESSIFDVEVPDKAKKILSVKAERNVKLSKADSKGRPDLTSSDADVKNDVFDAFN